MPTISREITALDVLENVIEYAKVDVSDSVFVQKLDILQEELLDYRAGIIMALIKPQQSVGKKQLQ